MKLTYNGKTYVIPHGYRVCIHESNVIPGRVRLKLDTIEKKCPTGITQLVLLFDRPGNGYLSRLTDTIASTIFHINSLRSTHHE